MNPPYISDASIKRAMPADVWTPQAAPALPPRLPGLHYVSGFDAGTINTVHWPHLRKCQYDWIVIVGAQQFSEAREFARNVQNDPIRTNVIFRHWKAVLGSFSDNGRLNDLNASQWMQLVGSQHKGEPYTLMPDNEGLGAMVVKNSAELVPMMSRESMKGAFGAWSSHNPPRADWPVYMPLFEQLYKHPEHVYAPHIYYSRKPKSVENMDGFQLVADHLAYVEQRMTAPIPFQVVITELGRLANPDGTWLDPDKGYALEGVSEPDYADELVVLTTPYRKWFFVTFCRGAWGTRGSLGVGKDYETRMEEYASGALAVPDIPAGPAETMIVKLLHEANGLKVRSGKTPASMELDELKPGDTVGYKLPTEAGVLVKTSDQWLNVYLPNRGIWGWVSTYYIEVPNPSIPEPGTPDTPVPPKEPEPTEPPPDDEDDTSETPAIQYVTLQEAKDMVDAAKEATMNYMKEWTLALLIELAKAESNAVLAKIALLDPKEAA